MKKPVRSVHAYFSIGTGEAHVRLWRSQHYRSWALNDARWYRLLGVMLRIGGEWHVAAPRDHCKVIWLRDTVLT